MILKKDKKEQKALFYFFFEEGLIKGREGKGVVEGVGGGSYSCSEMLNTDGSVYAHRLKVG